MFNNRLVLLNAQFSLKSIYKFSGNHLVRHTYGMDIHLSICVPPFNDDKYATSERGVQIRIKVSTTLSKIKIIWTNSKLKKKT